MKNDTTFVRMRSGDHVGGSKMSKKGTSLRGVYFLTNHQRQNGFRRMKEEGKIYKINLNFLPQDLVTIF